ncbi:phosphoribosylaminoimidazolecarboxamide formyltransferase [Fervidobacterium thailandense]|uniref:Phosphoribosylaminoimidazolecarboxamide formyltransferase n=1 Tax=Fervidobacterium thailandense TaxID=1008305 RepID=A0A1E3G398_9BACT|nr:phosphoribosylaminoimidazolecarboxamide formyltransferase [Fervidobacterium thailandense]
MCLEKAILDLRYGENPHETAFVFGVPAFDVLHEGKQLSFNNILDAEAAWIVASNLNRIGGGAVVVKHQNPCGAAYLIPGRTRVDCVNLAIQADAESSYGGILATSFPINREIAESLKTYLEVIVAPDFEDDAVQLLSKKKVRLIRPKDYTPYNAKLAFGSLIVSERRFDGTPELLFGEPQDINEVMFSLIVAEGVKSNAIVIVKNGVTVGIGGGQPSRKRAAWIAVSLAGEKAKGAVACSDAFFPFTDSLEILVNAGVKCVVAPLGSIRDQEVLDYAQRAGISFYKSPVRVFRH